MFSDKLIQKMKCVKRVVVLTGAGISSESGVPTFRGTDGLWKQYRPEQLATPEAFQRDPGLVWEWYHWRRGLIAKVHPNPGHETIVKMESMFSEFILITQNVDGLHRKAGSMNVLELHGNIMRNRCVLCGMTENVSDVKKEGIPYCDCSGIFRPDVVWFGESLSQKVIENACEGSKKSDLFFSIGTSAVVQPAASLPLLAKEGGSYVVEINRESTIISDYVDEVILGKSGEILPKLLDSVCSD